MAKEEQRNLQDPSSILKEQLVGTVFADRYEIDGLIGEGGMGNVYRAMHKLMKRTVAIKVVHPDLVSSADTLARFQLEAEAASSLNHPNIVTVHDFGLVPRAYMVMDYLDGVSLANLLENEAHVALDRSLHIFIQVCAGLAHAHQYGVVHRDLKPSNIMLVSVDGQTDFVKIVDFGIAKLMLCKDGQSKDLTTTGTILGSPLYMSPEQCQAKSMDARSDIYSLGCIMYRALSGHQPINGQELMECLYNHVNTLPMSFQEICPELQLPLELEAIVMKCLEKKQENRFQSMLELKQALEALDQSSVCGKDIPPQSTTKGSTESGKKVSKVGEQTLVEMEVSRAKLVAETHRAASAAEAGYAASALEDSLAASAAEAGRAASAAESARATSAAESARATSVAEAVRAANAAEAGRAASVAEAGRVASVHEAGLAASAVEAERAASAAESERAASATEPGAKVSVAELGRSASAVESSRVAAAAESARSASANEAALVAAAAESGRAASVAESGLAASAVEAALAASAHEAGLAAAAVESGRAASAAESTRAASAAEAGRAASAAEAGRIASAAED